jgi:hypothetical protein
MRQRNPKGAFAMTLSESRLRAAILVVTMISSWTVLIARAGVFAH